MKEILLICDSKENDDNCNCSCSKPHIKKETCNAGIKCWYKKCKPVCIPINKGREVKQYD